MTATAFDPMPGEATELSPGLRRILAPNPSPMTWRGTNTYLLGTDPVTVIDPGPDSAAHLAAIEAALGGAAVSHILVTHAHLDHSPLARGLAARTGAPVLAFGPPDAGRRPVMIRMARDGLGGGGEGVDRGFRPDRALADGEGLATPAGQVTALWTPGHMANHMCFAWEGALFTGDHVMGWASSLVSPPDGDLTAFMASCRALATRDDTVYHPGHGAPVTDPGARLAWLIAHREAREAAIRAALERHPDRAEALARALYDDIPPALLPAAARNVFAHLVALSERGLAVPDGPLRFGATFRAT